MTRLLLILTLLMPMCSPCPAPAQTLPVSWDIPTRSLAWSNPDSAVCLVYEQHSDRWWRQVARTRGESHQCEFGRRTYLHVWMCNRHSFCPDCGPQISALFIDWSQGAEVTMWVRRGDDSRIVAVLLPYGPWNVQWTAINPDTVTAWYEFDPVMDGVINLSDFSKFAQNYSSIYNLSDFASFAGMYQKRALLRYEGVDHER